MNTSLGTNSDMLTVLTTNAFLCHSTSERLAHGICSLNSLTTLNLESINAIAA